MWLSDVKHGYHHIWVLPKSKEKLALSGPGTTKWTWNGMLLGLTNGNFLFISIIHNIDLKWKESATMITVITNKDILTRIIVHNILSLYGMPATCVPCPEPFT